MRVVVATGGRGARMGGRRPLPGSWWRGSLPEVSVALQGAGLLVPPRLVTPREETEHGGAVVGREEIIVEAEIRRRT